MKEKDTLYQIVRLANDKKERGECLKFEEIKELLNEHMRVKKVLKEQYITTEHTTSKKVYYVFSGTFLMMRSSKMGVTNVFSRKTAPQFLGIDRAVLSDEYTFSDTFCLTDCFVMEIDAQYFVKCIKENAEFGFDIIKALCERLISASYRSDTILFYTSAEKLMFYIIEYWNEYHVGQDECIIKQKNMFIADWIGTSVRTLYRVIDELKQNNMVKVVKGNIVVTYEQVMKMKKQIGIL